jgi:hypothetical protein
MPAIADPYFAQYPTSRNHDRARRVRVRVRVRTALYRGELTRALAEGADPTESHEFTLRAGQLTSARSRRSLARAMRRTLDEAHRPPLARSRAVIIRRGAVLGAEDAIRSMIDQLESAEPLRARGLAMAERILTNADGSPLYNRAGPGALEWEINAATAAMSRPDRSQSHEFRVGV